MSATILTHIFGGAALGVVIPVAVLGRVIMQQPNPVARRAAAKVAVATVGYTTLMGAMIGGIMGTLNDIDRKIDRMDGALDQASGDIACLKDDLTAMGAAADAKPACPAFRP